MTSKFSSFNSNELLSDIFAKIFLHCKAYNVEFTVIPTTTWYYMYSVYVDPCPCIPVLLNYLYIMNIVLPVHVDPRTPILRYYLYMWTPVLPFYSTTGTCLPLYSYSTVLPVHGDPCTSILQ